MVPHKAANGFPQLAPSIGARVTKGVKCYTEESALQYYTGVMYTHNAKVWPYTQCEGVAMQCIQTMQRCGYVWALFRVKRE